MRCAHLFPICQHVLTAASFLTLDILWVINNEVAVPYHREINWQLADFHALVQILEPRERGREGGRGIDRKDEGNVVKKQNRGAVWKQEAPEPWGMRH